MHQLHFDIPDGGKLTVVDEAQFGLESADNVNSYDVIYHVPSRASRSYLAKRGVQLTARDETTKNCLLAFPSGGALLPSNVLLHDRCLFIASGVALAAIYIPELSLDWTVDLLTGADNGLHIFDRRFVLAIGDFDATLLTLDGVVRWASNIPGYLVPPGRIADGVLIIDDDDLQTHRLDLRTGNLLAR